MMTPRPTAESRPTIDNRTRESVMSATTSVISIAPMTLRLRLAVSALLVSWALAALFIVLGWRESRAQAADAAPAVIESQATQLGPPAPAPHVSF